MDVIDMTCELDKYKVLALPMVYMFKEGFAKKIRAFVENGGTLITSYWSGIADDTDRCYLEGTPHGLMDVLGIRSTEIDGFMTGKKILLFLWLAMNLDWIRFIHVNICATLWSFAEHVL